VDEALKEIKIAIDLWIQTAKREGKEIPKPAGKELLRAVIEETAVSQTLIK
jgi:predicted RNase H-like HicB family nuclease